MSEETSKWSHFIASLGKETRGQSLLKLHRESNEEIQVIQEQHQDASVPVQREIKTVTTRNVTPEEVSVGGYCFLIFFFKKKVLKWYIF